MSSLKIIEFPWSLYQILHITESVPRGLQRCFACYYLHGVPLIRFCLLYGKRKKELEEKRADIKQVLHTSQSSLDSIAQLKKKLEHEKHVFEQKQKVINLADISLCFLLFLFMF